MNYLYAALLSAVVAFGAAWKVQSWKYEGQIATMQKEAAEATSKARKEAADKTAADQKRKDDALEKAQVQARKNAASAAAARSIASSLREQLATARTSLPKASCEASRNYAATLSTVFGQCTQRLTEMARYADGHAADQLMLERAWPMP